MNQLSITNNSITSLELAQFSNKEHRHLLEAIRNMEQTWVELGQPKFGLTSYIDKSNRKSIMYNLSKTESLYIASKFSDEVRGKIILRWEELENQKQVAQVPTTFKEALLLAVEQQEKIEQLELETKTLEIELDKSHEWISIKKVAHANSVHWKSLEWKKLKDVSKITGYLPKKIFDANFPAGVNAYHVSAWKIVYPNLKY